ncbi:MAG TPA: choice-of-anchor Q domain-containing protein, partial [Gemmataceae bacterium]|nr:choice-of-anchor Q domain-containing protein [Gemmataceae bacterium]
MARRTRPAFDRRLIVHRLEDRTVPATFTVTNTADAGTGSLRDAITQADASNTAGDMILFSNTDASGTQTNFYDGSRHTISLQTALPTITDPVSVSGPGATAIVVTSATHGFGIFVANPGAGNSVSMRGLTVAAGAAMNGGGIQQSSGSLTLSGMVVTGNTASNSGGGVYFGGDGTLTITDCSIANNTAMTRNGGGIYSGPITVITNSVVSANVALTTGGGVYGYGTLTITGCSVAGNSARTLAGGVGGTTAIDILDSTISGNTAVSGGGVYGSGSVRITASTLANNCAKSRPDGTGGRGGAASVTRSFANLTIANSSLVDNTADFGGGAIYGQYGSLAIGNSTLSGNTSGLGGAIYFQHGGAFGITNSTVVRNTAGIGGGIDLKAFSGTANITSSTISGNTETGRRGITGYAGGIGIGSGNGTIILDNTIVSGNTSNGYTDISTGASGSVQARFSALGNSTGYALVDQGGNLIGADATPAALRLGLPDDFAGPNGTFTMVPLKYGGTAIDAGDPALAGTTDQRGLPRPQDTNPATNPNNR